VIPIPGFDIRYTGMEDFPYLQEWFKDPASLDDFPFGMAEKEESLKNWIGFSKYKASLTALVGETPVAIGTLFLMPYRKVAHHCSFFLIVDPKTRRKGIGTSMVRNLLHLAKTRFKLESVHVEIYEPSLLLPILLKLGFEEQVRQENFIKIHGEGRPRLILEHFFK
jgi:putative acetyltransferase